MIAEINLDHDHKIIRRSLTGEIDPNQAILWINETAFSVEQYKEYNNLVDIRDTTFEPYKGDLIGLASVPKIWKTIVKRLPL